jgi:hypothetical protein
MGGVRMTTGLYDENFFNNPARVTANPESKFTVLQVTPIEFSSSTPKAISDFSSNSGGDTLGTATNYAGKNLHARTQLVFPAFYLASVEERKYALAIGFIASIQADAALRQSYQTSLDGIADVGPAVTYGRKFLQDDRLSVGMTGHLTYRAGISPDYSILDYVRGSGFAIKSLGGEGAMVDFDLGSTYKLGKLDTFDFQVAGAIQNILGGGYSNISMKPLKLANGAIQQPRSYAVGVSATRADWWKLTNTVFAFEITDVGNNPNGSLFKYLHIGGETHWKSIAVRLGLNQGYLSAGLGLDVHYFTLDLATYGEELGLNAGSFEDRRYTFNFGFHI